MTDDYTNEPISLGEHKVKSTNSSMDIQPRELLINILRKIDSGELKPEKMIAVMTVKDSGDINVFTSQTRPYESVGLAMEVLR